MYSSYNNQMGTIATHLSTSHRELVNPIYFLLRNRGLSTIRRVLSGDQLRVLNEKGYDMLKYYWITCAPTKLQIFEWAYTMATSFSKGASWISFLCAHITVMDVCHSDLLAFSANLSLSEQISIEKAMIEFIAFTDKDFPGDPIASKRVRDLILSTRHILENASLQDRDLRDMESTVRILCDHMDKFVFLSNLALADVQWILIYGFSLETSTLESHGLWCSHLSEYSKDLDLEMDPNHDAALLHRVGLQLKGYHYFEAASKIFLTLLNRISRGNDCEEITLEMCTEQLKELQKKLPKEKMQSSKLNWYAQRFFE